jgi:hypothetical protein
MLRRPVRSASHSPTRGGLLTRDASGSGCAGTVRITCPRREHAGVLLGKRRSPSWRCAQRPRPERKLTRRRGASRDFSLLRTPRARRRPRSDDRKQYSATDQDQSVSSASFPALGFSIVLASFAFFAVSDFHLPSFVVARSAVRNAGSAPSRFDAHGHRAAARCKQPAHGPRYTPQALLAAQPGSLVVTVRPISCGS